MKKLLLFTTIFPSVTYANNAKRRLLQMPLVALRLQCSNDSAKLYLMEKVDSLDYEKVLKFLKSQILITKYSRCGMSKDELQQLLLIAQSERERECIRYAVFKSTCSTSSEARRKYGFDRMGDRAVQVEDCIRQAKEIHHAIDELANSQDKECYGIQDDNSSESDDEVETQDLVISDSKSVSLPNVAVLLNLLSESQFNWFEFVEKVECAVDQNPNTASALEEFCLQIPHLELDQAKVELSVQSHRAFMASSLNDSEQERTARAINGEIVSDSETKCFVGVSEVSSEEGKALVKKRRMAIRRKAVKLCTKAIAEQAFLSGKVTKRTSKLLQNCPTIGAEIESFVQDNNVGADAWRRTGVLTFDGNVKLV